MRERRERFVTARLYSMWNSCQRKTPFQKREEEKLETPFATKVVHQYNFSLSEHSSDGFGGPGFEPAKIFGLLRVLAGNGSEATLLLLDNTRCSTGK